MKINSLPLPLECTQHILNFNSPKDRCRFSQASRDSKKIADSNPVWDDFLKEGYKSYQTGKSAKDTFRDNLFAVHPQYRNLHPTVEKIYIDINEKLARENANAGKIFCYFVHDNPEACSVIINDEKFCNLILNLEGHETILCLYKISISHLESALIIFNNEKLYSLIADSYDSTRRLSWIAHDHPEIASIIFNNEKLYLPILNSPNSGGFLSMIAKSYPKTALIILSEEKFYSKVIQGDFLKEINNHYLQTEDHVDRENLLKKLKQIQANSTSDIRYVA